MWNLVQRYISGRATQNEIRSVKKWMDKDPANRQVVGELQQIWELTPDEDFDVNVKKAWNRFRTVKIKKKVAPKPLENPSKKRSSKSVIFRAAAVLLLAALVGFFSWQYMGDHASKKGKVQAYAMQKLVTKNGQKARVTFSDGTKVILNVASSLRFPKGFAGARREVYLNGEAYFEVAHNQSKPFIVHTATTEVKVLGTKFNVKAWREDHQVSVGVREGKVSVRSSDHHKKSKSGVLLTNGQLAMVKEGQVGPVQNIDNNNFMLWMGGGLYFNNVPFSQVARRLERKFDVRISIRNSDLMNVHFTGTFKKADLDKVLKVVATSMGITYTTKDSTIVFE